MVKKIVIIGPESTGKSTLCSQLADHYQTIWCPEFAREFLSKQGMHYSYDDLLTIARGQVTLEDSYMQKIFNGLSFTNAGAHSIANEKKHTDSLNMDPLLFIDTDMYVMKVWSEFVFGKCHRYILDQIVARKYDLYLLCDIDLPWIKDELREYPDIERRRELFAMYKDIMINQDVPWHTIRGNYDERLNKAILAVDKFLG
ncbi:MAG: ATPase [Hymenobacter sp.]|nr:MAG: ATPase [Hymenobacter sp.]